MPQLLFYLFVYIYPLTFLLWLLILYFPKVNLMALFPLSISTMLPLLAILMWIFHTLGLTVLIYLRSCYLVMVSVEQNLCINFTYHKMVIHAFPHLIIILFLLF